MMLLIKLYNFRAILSSKKHRAAKNAALFMIKSIILRNARNRAFARISRDRIQYRSCRSNP